MTGKGAFYRFEVKTISRGQRAGGRSVVACAAYRSGECLKDTWIGKRFDYSRRSDDVIFSEMLTPDDAPVWMSDAGKVFNAIEAVSVRKDARLAREFLLSLPKQLDEEQQIDLAYSFTLNELVRRGMVAQLSIHETDKGGHAHVLASTRGVDGNGFGQVREDWNRRELVSELRQSWAEYVNAALEDAGCRERVSHESLADRGIDRIPQPKLGVAATAMLRRGSVEDTKRHALVRDVEMRNQAIASFRDIAAHGHVQLAGLGDALQRDCFLSQPWGEVEFDDEPPPAKPPKTEEKETGWVAYIESRRQNHRHEVT